MVRLGTGDLVYELVEGWLRPPHGWDLIEVPGIAMDSRDRVYVLTRSDHPITVFDREGNFLDSWGEGSFRRPHGIFIGPDDSVHLVDDFAHTLRKCTPDGRVLMTIGVEGQASETGYEPEDFLSVKHGGLPFNQPTNVALSPEGDILVTDGYGNSRVHRFSPEGELLCSWGEPGSGPGQFRLVHGICVGQDGTVYVGDRMNSRDHDDRPANPRRLPDRSCRAGGFPRRPVRRRGVGDQGEKPGQEPPRFPHSAEVHPRARLARDRDRVPRG
jgi:hypothetical protein